MLITEPPVKDKWMLFNPPGMPEFHYHFVSLNRQGKMYSPFTSINHLFLLTASNNFFTVGKPVIAPEPVKVLSVHKSTESRSKFNFFIDLFANSPKDQQVEESWGSYVKIQYSTGQVMILKHLQSISDKIVAGQQLEKADQIGTAGSSGKNHVPGLGILCFTDESCSQPVKLGFVNVKLKDASSPDLFYPIQARSFTKIDS